MLLEYIEFRKRNQKLHFFQLPPCLVCVIWNYSAFPGFWHRFHSCTVDGLHQGKRSSPAGRVPTTETRRPGFGDARTPANETRGFGCFPSQRGDSTSKCFSTSSYLDLMPRRPKNCYLDLKQPCLKNYPSFVTGDPTVPKARESIKWL